MSEPTPGADLVGIPGQATGSDGRTPYRPRHRAETSLRPVEPVATVAPVAASDPTPGPTPTVPRQLARVYRTPAWAGGVAPAEPTTAVVEVDAPTPEFARPEGLLAHARWRTPRQGRAAVALLLVAFVAAAVATGTGAVQEQTTPALALALACLLGAAGMFSILAVLRPTVVELDEVWLTVRQAGYRDRFDLTNPFQELAMTGRVGSSRWRLRLGCPDGRVVVVTGAMVDSRRLEPVVAYAQRYADRERAARVLRFNR